MAKPDFLTASSKVFAGMYREADGPDECRKAAREQLKIGKLADMLILDENPLENIRVLRDQRKFKVVFGGRPVE